MNNAVKRELTISIQAGDAIQFKADVLVLKYAQALYGLDKKVFNTLQLNSLSVRLPDLSGFTFQNTHGVIGARSVLFVGVEGLRNFGYQEIREFSRKALTYLENVTPQVTHVALTIHGPGYGLDETEAFESELAGLIDAITSGEYPEALASITFVEFNFKRASRLSTALDRILPEGLVPVDGRGSISSLELNAQKILRTVGYSSTSKSHVFVAMPFAEEMDDVFHYGIQGAVNSAGLGGVLDFV